MPTVSQIQMQAAISPINEAIAQPGSLAGGSVMPVGFDTFLASLNQKMLARIDARTNSDKLSSPKNGLGALGMQNLPGFTNQDKDSAKITDPMQLLAAQMAAQGLINPVLIQPMAVSPLLNGGVGVNAIDSSKTAAGLNLPGANGLKGQNINPQQNLLITQSLARAMKYAGQGNNLSTQNPQVAQLMQMLQQAQPSSTAQASALEQLRGLVAQASQATPSQAPKITLTPELASAIRDLAQQAQPSSTAQASALEQLRGLVAQASQATPPTLQASSSDLKPVLAVPTSTPGAAEKLTTQIPHDRNTGVGRQNTASTSSQNIKNSENTLMPLFAGQASKENKGLDTLPRLTPESDSQTSEFEKIKDLAAQDSNSLNTQYSGLARLDSQTPEALQKFQIKQTEASLVSGPLHNEIMSTAKSGGGRIMFELTPPEQGTIRIDLHINQNGHAHLIVEGASDATKSRLDQGGQHLKQEFAQMGLNLSLDLRQGNQSHQASGQSFNNARQDYYANQQIVNSSPKNLAAIGHIGSGHNTSASGTVHLFA